MKTLLPSVVAVALLVSPALAEPIATTDGEAPGMKLDVTELKVSNGVVMMKFTLANDGDKPFDSQALIDASNMTQDRADVSGIYLLDTANKKKYLVVRDSENHCVCSRSLVNTNPKSSMNMWARFPAPPDNVQKIGIVAPHFLPMDDVPLSR